MLKIILLAIIMIALYHTCFASNVKFDITTHSVECDIKGTKMYCSIRRIVNE